MLHFIEENLHLRTLESHLTHLEGLHNDDGSKSTEYGVNGRSILMDLQYFHVCQCLVPDVIHDILEGALQYECVSVAWVSHFPHPVRCVCRQTIDNYGDNVLGYGPLRIKHHDALSEVVWHTLLMDNKGALREQRCGTNNNNRPGDVFHPDFSFGKPGYFDVSVRNSFQSQFLSRASHRKTAPCGRF